MPARTLSIEQTTNLCAICMAEGVNPPEFLTAQIDTDSVGIGERLSLKCPKHGPIKCLYNFPQVPKDMKNFLELYEDRFGPIGPEPKHTPWV